MNAERLRQIARVASSATIDPDYYLLPRNRGRPLIRESQGYDLLSSSIDSTTQAISPYVFQDHHDGSPNIMIDIIAANSGNSAEREVTPLPQIDRGRQAWSFVAAGFAIETLLWGGLFSTGVFLKYYAATEVGAWAW
jgi:hypothetical protein